MTSHSEPLSIAKFTPDLAKAISTRDFQSIADIVDTLRYRFRLNYIQLAEVANRATGISTTDWTYLLEDVDDWEAKQ